MKRRRWTGVAIAAVLALVLAAAFTACGDSNEGTSGSAAGGEPTMGGTLNVAFEGEPTELDPAIAWEVESWAILRLTYETFLDYANEPGDAGTALVPSLATEVPTLENGGITADAKTYTFHIREGVKFAPPIDRAVTAEDFKWSFERMMKEPLAPATFFYTGIVGAQDFVDGKAKDIKGYKVVDPQTVEITLEKPDGSFLLAMSMPFTSVMPKEWVEEKGKKIKREPLGTGPFTIESWTPGQQIVAKKNPNYWQQGKPYLDEIDFNFSATMATALMQLQKGQTDILADGIPTADLIRVKNDPELKDLVVTSPEIAWYYVFMNVLEKPYDNQQVRQAINYAIDTEKLQKLLKGQAKALNQIYPEGMPGHVPDKTYYSYDPAKAKEMLKAAGVPDGFKTTFYTHNVDPFPTLAQSIQADLKAVGIDAEIKQMDRATYWDFISLKESHAGIGLSDWYQDFPDPSDWIGPLFTQPIDGGANSSFWESDEVNTLYEEALSELNPDARIAKFQEMQDIIMDEAPTAPLYQPVFNGMAAERVGGYYYHLVWNQQYQWLWVQQ